MKTNPQTTKSTAGTLSVTGEGQIKLRPDIALVDLNVVTSARTTQQAVAQNAERMNKVIDALKALGLRSADLQTVGYDISPMIDHDTKSPTYGQILQYRVTAQLRSRVSVEQTGEAIDAAVRAGANMASGVRYALRDESSARTRALRAAVKNARRDAEAVAESLAIKLHNPEQVEISVGGNPIFFRSMAMMKADAAATPIEPGNIDIRATVRVTYRTS